MRTTKKPKKKLVEGALYLVETVEDTDTASHSIAQTLRWTLRGWRDEWGCKPRFSCTAIVRRVRPSAAPPHWQVILLREYVQKLERAGDEMASFFPFSSTHMKRVVGNWNEVRRVKP